MTVVPAYGRDYPNGKAAKADWDAGKDFLISDFSNPYDGKPINKEQAAGMTIMARFNRMRGIVKVQ